jgi:hypothetical protein
MSKTRDEMIARVLTKLGYNNAGQAIATEDQERVDDNLESIFGELAARQIFYIGDFDAFDDESFEPLADYLAGGMGDDFGKTAEWSEVKKASAIDRLEVIAAPQGTGEPLTTDPTLRAGAYRSGTYYDGNG